MKPNEIAVFDLDGTLAICDHRRHFVERPEGQKDWTSFFEACVDDVPNKPVIAIMHGLISAGREVEIWTGRSDLYNKQTIIWLADSGVPLTVAATMKMRPASDHRHDTTIKKEWLDAAPRKPFIVFEDRQSVVDMWRENNIACCQVAPGDF